MIAAEIRVKGTRPVAFRPLGFTLIELLTVIAIIALLIGILLPSLSQARTQAKNLKTKGTLKAVGDALELFRTENERERDLRPTDGYPPSSVADDPTITGAQEMFGAQWLVRYLMGKDLKGYVPRRNVPRTLQNPGADNEQVLWYEPDAYNGKPLERVGPYLDTTAVVATRDLPGSSPDTDLNDMEQQVLVDAFGYPVLYYVANPSYAARADAYVARVGDAGDVHPGIYALMDNVNFTGMCVAGTCSTDYPPWEFGGGNHPIGDFGLNNPADPATIADDLHTFPYYILNKAVYDSTDVDPDDATKVPTAIPYRKDTFLLITAGKDGVFGTTDDVTNW